MIPVFELALNDILKEKSNVEGINLKEMFNFLYFITNKTLVQKVLIILLNRIIHQNFNIGDINQEIVIAQENQVIQDFLLILQLKKNIANGVVNQVKQIVDFLIVNKSCNEILKYECFNLLINIHES